MDVVVDRLALVDSISPFGEGPTAEYAGQIFKAEGWRLHKVEFLIDTVAVQPGTSVVRLLVTTVVSDGLGNHPGQVLFESDPLFDVPDPSDSYTKMSVETGNLALVPGQLYAFVLDFRTDADGVSNAARLGMSYRVAGSDYPDGAFLFFDAPAAGDRAGHFASDWNDFGGDLSFALTFSTQGNTIAGTGKKDLIDGSNAPKNQPFASADDDRILGGKKNDKLFGLAGFDELLGEAGNDKLFGDNGGDLLVGGKGGDSLAGGAGKDFLLFNAGLGQSADRLKDFNPLDDTIWLSQKVFKALPLGVLSDAAFRDVGEAGGTAVRITYKANGDLTYDKDGKGGSPPVLFAALSTKPDLSAGDIVVVA